MKVPLVFGIVGVVLSAGQAVALDLTVGEPETVMTHREQRSKGLAFLDTGLSLVKINGTNLWLSTEHDHANREEGQVASHGPLDAPFEKIISRDVRIKGAPELRGAQDEPGNACWIGSAYYDPETKAILAFIHLEFWPPEGLRRKYMRFGLAVSEDGGKSFDWCGYIVSPDLPYEIWSNRWVKPGRKYPGSINMGWPNYIIKDGFFYLYYRDSKELPDRVEGGMAVARASMRKVIEAALKREVVAWHKYHEGQWEEPALGGKFTVLLKDRGLMHGDAAYCEPIKQYVLVVRDAKGKEKTGALLISFSRDGLEWTPWRDLRRDRHLHDYPTIVGLGPDNEVVGNEFYVYYKYDPDTLMPKKGGVIDWNRVKVRIKPL